MAVMHSNVMDSDALVEAANTLEMNSSMLKLATRLERMMIRVVKGAGIPPVNHLSKCPDVI